MKIIRFINRVFSFEMFISFTLIGAVNTVNGVIFSWFFSLFLNANVAFTVGYIINNIIGYILNSRFTFKEKLSFRKYIRFFISYIPNFIIQNVIVIIVHNTWKQPTLIAYAAAAVIAIPITFLLLNVFTFGKGKKNV